MKSSPLVSVMMPAKDVEKYISAAIESIINQTYMNWELIVVDDKSKDRTKEIAIDFQKKDPRIKIINGDGLCAANARNKAIDLARGEYIMNMDSDDISLPERIELLLNEAIKNKESVIGSNVHIVDESTLSIKNTLIKPYNNEKIRAGFTRFHKRHTLIPQTMLVTSTLLKKCKYNEFYKSMEDWDLIIRLSEISSIVFTNVQKCLYLYRINNGSMSLDYNNRTRYNLLLLCNQYRRKMKYREFQSIEDFEKYMKENIIKKTIYYLLSHYKKTKSVNNFKEIGFK